MEFLDFLHQPGPEFLAFYACVLVAVLAAAAFAIVSADRSDTQNLPKAPSAPDPVELAYLSGGPNQVLRTLIYGLCQKGHLRLDGDSALVPAQNPPSAAALTELEARALQAVGGRAKISDFFGAKGPRAEIERLLAPLAARLAAEDLLRPAAVVAAGWWSFGLGALLLAGLALAKIDIGLALGRPVGFLVMLSIFGLVGLLILTLKMCSRPHSRRGRAYLDRVRAAYSSRMRDALSGFHAASVGGATTAGATSAAVLLLVGLDGFNALKGTPDAVFSKAFAKGAGGGGGGCGSSCSSGGGDGGGGGGGCGGCRASPARRRPRLSSAISRGTLRESRERRLSRNHRRPLFRRRARKARRTRSLARAFPARAAWARSVARLGGRARRRLCR